MRDYFGHDPELPAGFQEADFDQRELEAAGRRAAAERAAIARNKALPFAEWMARVDRYVGELAGCSAYDLPDWRYADAHAEGMGAKVAARAVIRNAREG